jgi:hypothetical protein
MNKLKEMFGQEKPVIALLHIKALPGDPWYSRGDTMEKVVDAAKNDLRALQDGGVDGILFSNEYSFPYQPRVDAVTVAAMSRVVSELRHEIRVPFGVHVISDADATIELAAALDAHFVRSVFTGAYAGEAGLQARDIAKTLRRRNELNLRGLMMFYMITAESDGDLSGRKLPDIAQAIIFKCQPDALCVSGKSAGREADPEQIAAVRAVSGDVPILCNTGVNYENVIARLASSDGAFVGTGFKIDGKFENAVDGGRVRMFMDRVNEYRSRK